MTKWEKRRVSRHYARKHSAKKPLVQLLTMSKTKIRGKTLLLLDGKKTISVPLWFQGMSLQGVYKTFDGRIITARFLERTPYYDEEIKLYELKNGHETAVGDTQSEAFFWSLSDIGHMYLPKQLRGTGLAAKVASRADRHIRSQQKGKNIFSTAGFREELFGRILKKIGYRKTKRGKLTWVFEKKRKSEKRSQYGAFPLNRSN